MTSAPEWAQRAEQGHALALRLMAWIAVTLGRPAARLLLHPITLYYLAFAAPARRASRRYLARAFGRPARWREVYRHLHAFAATVLDRVYFVRGELQSFDIALTGGELVDAQVAAGGGAFLLGAHIGSFESLHAIGASRPGLRVAMAMYPDNARKIHAVLRALAPAFELGIIPIGQAGSTLAIREWLAGGGLVGLLGDRQIGPEGPRTGSIELPFLGHPATFSEGPLRLALLLRKRVIFMVGLYLGGRRYEVRFLSLADFSLAADAAARETLLREALVRYVSMLEALVREAPYNWFNFYDYWCEDPPAATP
ncbi:MAG: acyl-CoA synthetase [Burkholderiales bacterium]|nr:acyl-CoA synthetase [Burkholderiales bacterium]MDE1929372.1 acyl-CoA synthetase [Burkholderiales bacterium]MDE2161307.1 acyl-CoA synthetase [Burkholderiales bacterium]MDE2505170.1 acyl-CoA synthetase [Burkholderiales bacterium]